MHSFIYITCSKTSIVWSTFLWYLNLCLHSPFRLALTFPWQPSSLFCVRHFPRPLFLSLPSTTLQANHNAHSDNTGQSLRRFYQYNCKKSTGHHFQSMCCHLNWNTAFTIKLKVFGEIYPTNPTGRCQTRPAGCCPSGPGYGQDPAMDRCGGPGQAECQHGSQHLPSWGLIESPGHRQLGRPCRFHLNTKGK